MGELIVIGSSSKPTDENFVAGDLTLNWRKDNAEEIALAGKTFTKYISEGWLAFGEISGDKELIFTFDPEIEKITLFPIVMGG
ncbi:hypothetical protein ACFLUO_02390 [Chloroflexota bacterium]